jgi:hypothetical protein
VKIHDSYPNQIPGSLTAVAGLWSACSKIRATRAIGSSRCFLRDS